MSGKRFWIGSVALASCALGAILRLAPVRADGPPAGPAWAVKVSEFAPAEDLIHQIEYFIGRFDESLASKDAYDDAAQSRVAKEADTVKVLALGLNIYDGKHRFSESSGRLLFAAQELVSAGNDYPAARRALDKLKAVLDGKAIGHEPPPTLVCGPVARLGLLMKEVPIVQANMKRSLQGERFKTQGKQAAAAAATLAMIAEEVAADDSSVKLLDQRQKWRDECFEMRDAAGAVNHAVHAGDAEAAQKAVARLSQSCVACHADFRHAH